MTPGTAGLNGPGSSLWEGISQTLAIFTAVRYSRNGGADGTALDATLAEGQDLIKRLWRYQLVRFGRSKHPARDEAAKQSWAR